MEGVAQRAHFAGIHNVAPDLFAVIYNAHIMGLPLAGIIGVRTALAFQACAAVTG